jgi:hypothetical protein
MSNQLVTVPQTNGLATYNVEEAKHRYNALVEYVQKLMVSDRDYGKIPGSDKPTLLKPGAEKLRSFFGFRAPIELIEKTEDWDKGFFHYIYRCNAYEGDSLIASCEASANSKETKYRYRNVMEWEATEDDKKNAVKIVTKQKKNGMGSFKIYKLENTEPFDLVNTLQKMAQKRAFVGAVLLAANASEFFTQDIEDLDYVDAEFTPVQPVQPTHPVQPTRPAQPAPANNGHKTVGKEVTETADFNRPYAPEVLKTGIEKKVTRLGEFKASDKQIGLLASMLDKCFAGETNSSDLRHAVQEYLTGYKSSKEMPGAYVKVLLDWLDAKQDDGGDYTPSAMAIKEAQAIRRQSLLDAGQMDLLATAESGTQN